MRHMQRDAAMPRLLLDDKIADISGRAQDCA